MSLRPYFQAFSIAAFDQIVGSNDEDVKRRLHARVDETLLVAARDAAHLWVDRIVSGEVRTHPPEVEDETLQSVIVLCARVQPVVDNSCWGFWEALGNHVDRSFKAATGTRRKLSAWLLYGRPRFANRIASSWTICAFIANEHVPALLEVANDETLRADMDHDAAVVWLERMQREGRDLLWVCN